MKLPIRIGLRHLQGAVWAVCLASAVAALAQPDPPDRDSDGIADHVDHCPGVPGDSESGGCPSVVVQALRLAERGVSYNDFCDANPNMAVCGGNQLSISFFTDYGGDLDCQWLSVDDEMRCEKDVSRARQEAHSAEVRAAADREAKRLADKYDEFCENNPDQCDVLGDIVDLLRDILGWMTQGYIAPMCPTGYHAMGVSSFEMGGMTVYTGACWNTCQKAFMDAGVYASLAGGWAGLSAAGRAIAISTGVTSSTFSTLCEGDLVIWP